MVCTQIRDWEWREELSLLDTQLRQGREKWDTQQWEGVGATSREELEYACPQDSKSKTFQAEFFAQM